MITVNYQTFGAEGFQLRLRLYQSGETKYINVTKLLKGAIKKQHWNQRKQRFLPSCPYSVENNDILVKFRQPYDEMAIGWSGSVFGMVAAMEERKDEQGGMYLHDFIMRIVDEMKERRHADGTRKGTYESYKKLDGRLKLFCEYRNIQYSKLRVSDVCPSFVNSLFDWVVKVRKGKGHVYISAMLHSVLMRADREGYIDWNDFKNCKWRGKNRQSVQKYNTLTAEQCKRFVELKKEEMPRNPRSELYRDFCTFILYTGQSVCDAVALKYSDIKSIGGVDHFVFKRRKIAEKQAVPCTVPINNVMRGIMQRWERQSRDGYVFPIRNKQKLATQTTNNGDIKHFISRLNNWLKKVGALIGCTFPLHTYTFRHTAITHYLSKEVPVIYVANIMGTSVKNCEQIYYNNQGDTESRNKVLQAISF